LPEWAKIIRAGINPDKRRNKMFLELKEMQEKRNRAIATMKSMIDRAESQRRGLSAQDKETYDRLFKQVTDLRTHIETELRLTSIENELEGKKYNDPGAQYRHVMRKFLVHGQSILSADEKRTLAADNDTLGGFMLMPEEWTASLIAAVTNLVRVRELATKYKLQHAISFYGPSVENDFDDPDWTAEAGTINEDTSFSAGRRELTPHLLTKAVRVSNRLLRASAGLAENIVIDRLSYKIAVAEEKGFLTGNGVMQPLGVFTTSNQGIPVSRDIVVPLNPDGSIITGSSTYEILIDALIAAKYSIKGQYWPRMEWFIHKDILKIIATLKTGDGYYLYHASEDPKIPDTLLGRPINLSEYAPNTISSGNYVAILGDFTWYSICDLQEMEIKVLNELYALNNETGIIIKKYSDGTPVLAEAFARIQVQ
jgi:HK97 family phage major capsid protein